MRSEKKSRAAHWGVGLGSYNLVVNLDVINFNSNRKGRVLGHAWKCDPQTAKQITYRIKANGEGAK